MWHMGFTLSLLRAGAGISARIHSNFLGGPQEAPESSSRFSSATHRKGQPEGFCRMLSIHG